MNECAVCGKKLFEESRLVLVGVPNTPAKLGHACSSHPMSDAIPSVLAVTEWSLKQLVKRVEVMPSAAMKPINGAVNSGDGYVYDCETFDKLMDLANHKVSR